MRHLTLALLALILCVSGCASTMIGSGDFQLCEFYNGTNHALTLQITCGGSTLCKQLPPHQTAKIRAGTGSFKIKPVSGKINFRIVVINDEDGTESTDDYSVYVRQINEDGTESACNYPVYISYIGY